MYHFKAYEPPEPTLDTRYLSELCIDHVNGLCRGTTCVAGDHVVYLIEEKQPVKERIHASTTNFLCTTPRKNFKLPFENDGPGFHASLGVRHDNDHVPIAEIKILPTTDEILCARQPYMPSKLDSASHRLSLGPERLLDIHFRQLRHENVAPICDVFYSAMQVAVASGTSAHEHRRESANGQKYSILGNARYESVAFNEKNGATFRISYDCPVELRGRAMSKANIFEEGMLCGIVALHEDTPEVNVILYQTHLRESTEAMHPRTGNHLRAAVQVCMADANDIEKVRQSTYYTRGVHKAKFFLVDLSTVLPVGFMLHLERLQMLSVDGRFAFKDQIAPSSPGLTVDAQPPEPLGSFQYNLSCLKKDSEDDANFLLESQSVVPGQPLRPIQQELETRTTLDNGQANALYENLNRNLAFTQGPPGTGKTYLGVKEVEVLLNSRSTHRKPVLVVCMTNHALDDFILSLKDNGINKIARLGGGSSAKWITPYLMKKIRTKFSRNCAQSMQSGLMRAQVEGVRQQGAAFANSLSSDGKDLWMILVDYFRTNEPAVYEHFVRLDSLESSRTKTDIRQTVMFQGFALMFWLEGGDIQDVTGLIDAFETILGKSDMKNKFHSDSEVAKFKTEASAYITKNVEIATATGDRADLWILDLSSRKKLAEEWCEAANSYKICEAFAELHRRHQELWGRQKKLLNERDREVLEQSRTDVIGLTSTGCARYWELLNSIEPRVVMFEEASELTEAHSICALFPSVNHCIQIGDPLQLRPQVQQMQLSLENDSRYRLDESLFQRLTSRGMPFSKLDTQRRAHPDIADLLRAGDYPYLLDHPATISHPPVAGLLHRMFWYDHSWPEDTTDPKSGTAKSFSNKFEVDFIYAMVKYLVLGQGYKFHDITILTPYNGQIAALTHRLSEICSVVLTEADQNSLIDAGLTKDNEQSGSATFDIPLSNMLRIATVDNYQGEQARIVLFSAVRSNHNRSAGFLKSHNRINVAISRAEDGFYVIGNSRLVGVSNHWAKIINAFRSKNIIGDALPICCACHGGDVVLVRKPSDFQNLPVCVKPCSMKLLCGHTCHSACHPLEMHNDGRLPCSQRCIKILKCGHACKSLCGAACGACTVMLDPIDLSCGHSVELACHSQNEPVICLSVVEQRQLKCGHSVTVRCFEKSKYLPCKQRCGTELQCGHACLANCTKCSTLQIHSLCTAPCGKLMPCTHSCTVPCHKGDCPPCQQPCLKECSHKLCKEACSFICDPCVVIVTAVQEDAAGNANEAVICCLSGLVLDGEPGGIDKVCDLLYRKCGKQMAKSFQEVSVGEELAFNRFPQLCDEIKIGPLSARLNQQLISERGEFLTQSQEEASRFRDQVVHQIQGSILKAHSIAAEKNSLLSPIMPFALRFDLIYLHSRLVMNIFGHQLVRHLRTRKAGDRYTALLGTGLAVIVVDQAKRELENIRLRVEESSSLKLKRLEVEMRIVQLCFWTVLRSHNADKTVKLDVNSSLNRISTLIDRFPHTAGLLKDAYNVINKSIKGRVVPERVSDVFHGAVCQLWSQWATHVPGALTQCRFRHPYSTAAFPDGCPECGEEKGDPLKGVYDSGAFLRHFGIAC